MINAMGSTGRIQEVSEGKELKGAEQGFSQKSLDKYDKILGDDKFDLSASSDKIIAELNDLERENKFNQLFEKGDFFKRPEKNSAVSEEKGVQKPVEMYALKQESEVFKKREPNSEYEFEGNRYATDDNGQTYKRDGELLPNTKYAINGNLYKTDVYGNKVSCESRPEYTETGIRNMKEQKEAGGEERQEDDDGGHIIARMLGGFEGEENLVPMRRTINRGDYKKMENEIASALQDGKEVLLHVDLEYVGESQRPSKIRAEYIIDGKNTVVEFDNEENSLELSDSLKQKISSEDYNNLKEEIEDMKNDKIGVSITSVKTEYDGDNPIKVTVGMLDESTGKKTYKVYEPRQEV